MKRKTIELTDAQYCTLLLAVADGIDWCTEQVSLSGGDEEWDTQREAYEALETYLHDTYGGMKQ